MMMSDHKQWAEIPEQENSYFLNNAKDLDPLLDRIGRAHHVLLGEATHGTHEYYTWRTVITKRLVQEKGFSFIAVEGDWPDCYKINRFVKGLDDQEKKAKDILKTFDRWPTWMWANWEIVGLIDWLKDYNKALPLDKKVGFYGLDVYSLWGSMEAIMDYLEKHDPNAAEYAIKAIQCFEPYGENEQRYARAQYSMENSCQDAVLGLLTEIKKKAPIFDHDPEAALNVEQNAEIAVNAENYYRNMIDPGENTWNLRDRHMMATLNRILNFHGPESKAIVWEHNTHIGDARFTNMAKSGDINVGQLVREQKGEEDVVLVGFGSYSGTVIAGPGWAAPMEKMSVPPARTGSIEEVLHNESEEDRMLIFNRNNKKERFSKVMPHRAIGVVYNPEHEGLGNYVPTVLNSRYDAFVFIHKTKALHPLHIKPDGHKVPETFPFEF
jgi:erythromycin esterase-like protein